MVYELNAYGETYNITLTKTHYSNKSLAIVATTTEGEAWDALTVNLDDHSLKPNQAYVDTNSGANYEQFIKDNNIGVATGKTQKSGYVEYPLYEFNLDAIK